MKETSKLNDIKIKTGIALFVTILAIAYINSFFIIWLFFGILLFISIIEVMGLYQAKVDSVYIYTAILWFVAYFYPNPYDLVFLLALIYASLLAYNKNLDKKIFLPLLYPTTSFLFLLSLYNTYGISSLLWLLAIVISTDVAGYYVGKSIGKRKLCKISPNKTLEGAIGAIIVATILGTIFSIENISLFTAVTISILVAISSIFGDLFESYLKRQVGVKDSSDILPGHGGILDRVDGYLFGSITMLVLLKVVM